MSDYIEDHGVYAYVGELKTEIARLTDLLEAKTTPGYELLAGTLEKQEAEIAKLRADLERHNKLRLRDIDEIAKLCAALEACVAYIRGEISGGGAVDGILRQAAAALANEQE
jgi:hypothetical protein